MDGKPEPAIGKLAISGRNLDVIQLYTHMGKTGGGSSRRCYSIDYLLRVDIGEIDEENFEKLETHTEFKRRGSIFKSTQRQLQDLELIAGRPSVLTSMFKIGRKSASELVHTLNSDTALKSSLVEEFKKPWVMRDPGLMEISLAPLKLPPTYGSSICCERLRGLIRIEFVFSVLVIPANTSYNSTQVTDRDA